MWFLMEEKYSIRIHKWDMKFHIYVKLKMSYNSFIFQD
jgi:hypothetical protein